jgi:hypothetical protein
VREMGKGVGPIFVGPGMVTVGVPGAPVGASGTEEGGGVSTTLVGPSVVTVGAIGTPVAPVGLGVAKEGERVLPTLVGPGVVTVGAPGVPVGLGVTEEGGGVSPTLVGPSVVTVGVPGDSVRPGVPEEGGGVAPTLVGPSVVSVGVLAVPVGPSVTEEGEGVSPTIVGPGLVTEVGLIVPGVAVGKVVVEEEAARVGLEVLGAVEVRETVGAPSDSLGRAVVLTAVGAKPTGLAVLGAMVVLATATVGAPGGTAGLVEDTDGLLAPEDPCEVGDSVAGLDAMTIGEGAVMDGFLVSSTLPRGDVLL